MSNNDVVQPVDEISPASEKLKDWVVNIEARLDNSTEEIPPTRPPTKKIPSIYGNWKCLDDHFQNVPFLPETNMWQFVAYLKHFFNLNIHSYLEELQEKEDDLWSYYEGVDEEFRAQNSKRFIEYLLANSCFLIIALAISTHNWNIKKELPGYDDTKMRMLLGSISQDLKKKKMRIFNEYKKIEKFINGEHNGILRYMLTMDYQIPWFVVEAVYTKHSNLSSKLNTPIHELVISVFENIYPKVSKSKLHYNTITVPQDGFQHLLHIFHWSRTPKEKFLEIHPAFDMRNFYIPSATHMQLCATVFHKHAASGFDVSFYKRILSGVMQLPPWSDFLHKNEIYKHLLVFERGYGMVCGFSVTAYVACIVHLVQTEEDVTLLRAKRIILKPGDQKDLLSSLQGYKTILLSNDVPVSYNLMNLVLKIKSHSRKSSSIKKYYADFKRRYCSNPWITLSVVGGILLFVLTFFQTVLSYIQTKYSVLSYKQH